MKYEEFLDKAIPITQLKDKQHFFDIANYEWIREKHKDNCNNISHARSVKTGSVTFFANCAKVIIKED